MPASSSPSLLARVRGHQRIVLFIGSAALTLFILLAFVLGLIGFVREDLNDERQTFQRDLGRVMEIVGASETRVRIVAAGVETTWESTGAADAADVSTFDAQGGRIVFPAGRDSPGALILRLSRGEDSGGPAGHFLAVAKSTAGSGGNLVKTMNDAVGLPWGLSGYLVTPAASLVGINPLPDLPAAQLQRAVADPARLSGYYAAGLEDLASWSAAQRGGSRQLRWLPPQADPLTGRARLRVLALLKANGQPVGVVGGEFSPQRLIERLEPGSFSGAYWVVDQRAGVVTGSAPDQPDLPLVRQAAARCRQPATAAAGVAGTTGTTGTTETTETYRGGRLLICAPLGGTGWTLAYAVPSRIIAGRVARDIAAPAIATGLAIALLWTFVLLFNRKILAPLFERSERVFDSEHLSRTLIETVPVGLALVNANDNTVLLESAHMQALERRIGTVADGQLGDVLKQHAPAAFAAPPGHAPAALDVELHLPADGGGTIDVAAKLAPSHYQGQPVVVATLSDVTAERQLARELAAAKQAADSANAAKSVFLASMSHEIRTPLNAILGHLELLERLPQAVPVASRVRTIASSSRALLDILNDILDFSKIEAGEMRFESIRFDVAALIRETVAMFMPLAQRKGLALEARFDAALPRYYLGDPGRVRQIVANLLGNAIKFTDRGRVSVDVGAGGAGTPLLIRVTDTGIGIAPGRQAHIFDAFDQVDASITRRFGGTGLGLALCRRIAEAMGGTVAVTSEVGHGSLFTVTLPIRPDHRAALASEAEAAPVPEGPDARGIHVLVAEDHEVNRELIRDQLDTLGYTSDIVENGLVALRHFNERHYDLVLTDLAMPAMDGYTLATCLRNQGSHTPIIAITADVTAADSQRLRDAGISGVLLKPMSLASIDAAARRHLSLSGDPRAEAAIADADDADAALPEVLRSTLEQRTAESLQAAASAIAQGDRTTVSAEIHSIKGAFAMLHATDVVEVCSRLEALLADEPGAAAGELQHALAEVGNRASSALARMARDAGSGRVDAGG
ncbi:ATP-binding protein [Cupriavidus sp. 30B13]|uniref:ATP-binding protein n=1 Tax=Cupriavidus sp. 30B13 TaxID=3384241 RepID=UPI003B8FD442